MFRRRHLKNGMVVILVLAAAAAAAVAGWRYVTAEHRLVDSFRRNFQREVHPDYDVTVGRASLTPSLILTFHDGALETPQAARPLVAWDEVRVELNPRMLLRRRVVPRRVTIRRPVIHAMHRPETGRWNVEEFLSRIETDPPRFRELLLDGVHVEDATLLLQGDSVFGDDGGRTISGLHMTVHRQSFVPGVWVFSGRITEGLLQGTLIEGSFDSDNGLELVAKTDILHVDDDFFRRIPLGREIDELLQPRGTAGGELALRIREIDGRYEPAWFARVRADDMTATSLHYPIPAARLRGCVDTVGRAVHFRDISGIIEWTHDGARHPSPLNVSGSTCLENRSTFVHIRSRSVPLTEETVRAIPGAGEQLWTLFRPAGAADLDLTVDSREDAAQTSFRAAVRLHDAAVHWEDWPVPLTGLRGELLIDESEVEIRHVTGALAPDTPRSSPYQIDGVYDIDRGRGLFNVAFSDLVLDRNLVQSLPLHGEELWDALQLEGRLSLHAGIEYVLASGEDARSAGVAYTLDAEMKNASARWTHFPVLFTFLSGPVQVSDGTLIIPRLTGQACGGQAEIWATASRGTGPDEVRYNGAVDFRRVDMRTLLRELTGQEMDVAGKLSGTVEIAGQTGDEPVLQGHGEIHLTEGRVWRAPVLLGLIDVLHLSRPGAFGRFDRGFAQFTIEDESMHVSHFELRSPSAELTGWGRIGWKDGDLDLTLVAATVPEGGVPLLSPALKTLLAPVQRELIRIQVSGTIAEPRYTHSVIGKLTRPAQTLYDMFTLPMRLFRDNP